MDANRKLLFFIIFMKEIFRKKISVRKRYSKFLQMLHLGKFYADFRNINLPNFTLVIASELNVNGGRIWVHGRREFWFTDLWNKPGLHEITQKEDFRIIRPIFEYFVHLVRLFIAKSDTQSWKAISVYCPVEVGNRKQLPFEWKKICGC